MGFEIAIILPIAAIACVFNPSRFFLASSMSKFSLCVTAFLIFSLRFAKSALILAPWSGFTLRSLRPFYRLALRFEWLCLSGRLG
nr:MAG TPA: hypothetical protein [Caudoviricetes sp.]